MAQLLMKRPIGAEELESEVANPVQVATKGDARDLARLLTVAFPEQGWTVERVLQDLLDADDVPTTDLVRDRSWVIATASVRYVERFPESGYVHWVAVDPRYLGRRLSHVVMASVIRQFFVDGRRSSILETDDFRLPAIAAYLGVGFIPQYTESDHEDRWSRVFSQLAQWRRSSEGQ
jgi:GNAT superfamily N-acetyltransferase